jgi:hypothetical protein
VNTGALIPHQAPAGLEFSGGALSLDESDAMGSLASLTTAHVHQFLPMDRFQLGCCLLLGRYLLGCCRLDRNLLDRFSAGTLRLCLLISLICNNRLLTIVHHR